MKYIYILYITMKTAIGIFDNSFYWNIQVSMNI